MIEISGEAYSFAELKTAVSAMDSIVDYAGDDKVQITYVGTKIIMTYPREDE